MRITAGEFKNRKIKSREGRDTRPTLERIKEAVYSIIGEKIVDAKFLDLYSGTGNMALEGISRGAKRAIMIEQEKDALKVIIENINDIGIENRCRAYKNDVHRALEILGRKNEKFDIIFLDPPYKENISIKTIKGILKNNLLEDDGIIISEHSIYENMPTEIDEFVKYDERNYNKKMVTFYKYKTK